MSDIERVALAIAKGGLFGSTDPNAVLTLCLLAQAEGQHPAVVFRDYHIIKGKPAKKADAMLRDFLSNGGKIEWHQLDDECVDATFSHPSGGSARITWDKKRVQQAQLGGNDMHKKYPRQMLRSRVISEGVRTVFPGATSGLYETGEVQDMVAQDRAPSQARQEPQERPAEPEQVEHVERTSTKKREPLTGPMKTRAEARLKYGEIVRELNGCADTDMLEAYLASEHEVLAQFEMELPNAWNGDGADFIGLRAEIDAARIRCTEDGDAPYVPNILDAG
jgi:hypothetical protein